MFFSHLIIYVIYKVMAVISAVNSFQTPTSPANERIQSRKDVIWEFRSENSLLPALFE